MGCRGEIQGPPTPHEHYRVCVERVVLRLRERIWSDAAVWRSRTELDSGAEVRMSGPPYVGRPPPGIRRTEPAERRAEGTGKPSRD